MSLRSLLSPVLPQFPQVQPDMEIEVLHELPVETVFLALKAADAETAMWFYESALPEQVQGLIDLEVWDGHEFLPERAEDIFKSICQLNPVKLLQYMKGLDPEFIVRTLMELCSVQDYLPTEPLDMDDNAYLLSPDSKYALILKSESPEAREALYQWLNRLSSASLDVMRRHLEACKWEQISDLEEYAYTVKKGRLEDMGFVDSHEAMALYAHSTASALRKELIENPISKSQKTRVRSLDDATEREEPLMPQEWLPRVISEPLGAPGFLAKALAEVKSSVLKEVLLQEIIRTVNASLAADRLMHADLEQIAVATSRARKYLDLGLTYISQGSAESGAQWLEAQPLASVYRLGWLVIQDLSKAAKQLTHGVSARFFGEIDGVLIESLQVRHPELDARVAQDIGGGLQAAPLVELDQALKVGERLAQLAWVQKFFTETLETTLRFSTDPLKNGESAYARLATLVFRQQLASGKGPSDVALDARPLSTEEWTTGAASFDAVSFQKSLDMIAEQAPAPAKALLQKRLRALAEDLTYFTKNNPKKKPDPRFFKCLVFAEEK
ncbi:MAG: DUF6178 family protein [Bdellovibrionota bacterium]